MNSANDQVMRLRIGPGAAILPPSVKALHLELASENKWGFQGVRAFWREHLRALKYNNPGVPMIVNRTRDVKGPATLSIYLEGDEFEPRDDDDKQQQQPQLQGTVPHSLPSPDFSAESEKAGSDIVPFSSTPSTTTRGKAARVSKRTFDGPDPWVSIHSHAHGGAPAPPARVGETRLQIDAKFKKAGDLWAEFLRKSGARPVELTPEEKEHLDSALANTLRRKLGQQVAAEKQALEAEKKRRLDAAIAEAAALKQG